MKWDCLYQQAFPFDNFKRVFKPAAPNSDSWQLEDRRLFILLGS